MACIYKRQYSLINNHSGFTLVELIVVILIVGILSVSFTPRFFGVASYEDRRAADELRSAIRHTQQMAMNRGGNIQLLLTANNFTVQRSTTNPAERDLRSPDGLIPYVKIFPTNVAVSSIPALPATISFDRLGRPDTGYVITLGSQQVSIEDETGYAR